MWTYQTEIDVAAKPQTLWALFADVAGWPKWNAGIETIDLRGPFANGSEFTMKPPSVDGFVTTLADVREGQSFTDVTVIDGTTVRVFHGLTPLGTGGTRVTYRAEVTGDFDDVLAALKRTAEG